MGSVSLAVKKYLSNKYCVEVKDESYLVHLTQSKVLREHKGPKFSRTQYKNYLETKIGRNQKVNASDKGKLEVKSQPKMKIRQEIDRPQINEYCPSCKKQSWIELDQGLLCQKCQYHITKHNHQIA